MGRLAEALLHAGCAVEVATASRPHERWRRVLDLWDPGARRAMRHTIAAFQPDVVHYHNILNELSSSVVGLGVPSVVTVHDPRLVGIRFGPDQDDPPWKPVVVFRSAKNRLARIRLRRSVSATIAPSAALSERLVAAGFPAVHHIENFAPRIDPGPLGPDVAFVGALQPHKGPQVLLAAWELIAARHPASTLCFVGDGPLRSTILTRAEVSGLAGQVRLLGRVEPADVAAQLGSAALVVVPSLGVEGGGPTLAVIEAMAAGRPVVVTDRPGVSEGVDASVGAVVPAGDAAALARAVDAMLGDRARLSSLGENAASRAEERWDPGLAAARVMAVYEDLLAMSDHRRPTRRGRRSRRLPSG